MRRVVGPARRNAVLAPRELALPADTFPGLHQEVGDDRRNVGGTPYAQRTVQFRCIGEPPVTPEQDASRDPRMSARSSAFAEGLPGEDSFDLIAHDLQALRARAGHVSYGEIVRRVGEQRLRENPDAPHPYPARSTVYDVFRPGRRRMNEALLQEIVRALGEDDEHVALWADRCVRAAERAEALGPGRALSSGGHAIGDASSQRMDDRTSAIAGEGLGNPDLALSLLKAGPDAGVGDTAVADVVDEGAANQAEPHAQRHGDVRGWQAYLAARPWMRLALAVLCLAINMFGHWFAYEVHLPVYADMVGTAVAALMLGPWRGAAVGFASALTSHAMGLEYAAPFAIVNAAGGIVWGYGWRMIRLAPTTGRYLLVNLAVAVTCGAVGGPISLLVYGGPSPYSADQIAAAFFDFSLDFHVAFWLGSFLTEIGDKLIVGFLAIPIVEALSYVFRPTRHLTASEPLQRAEL